MDLEAIAYAVIDEGVSLTQEQRVTFVEHADWCAEGALNEDELMVMDDVQLSKSLLNAMSDWVACNF